MPDWRPGAKQEALESRAALLARIRSFFAARGVLEVETPLLGQSCAVERNIEPLSAEHPDPARALSRPPATGYLQTSPELFMKRLLAADSGPIYQVSRAFRRDEAGRLHNPEFSLLEWYRPGFTLQALMDEVADLVRHCLDLPHLPAQRVSYRQLFIDHLALDPLVCDTPALRDVAQRHGLRLDGPDTVTRDTWLDLLLSGAIAPRLADDAMLFVHDYPADQAGLARLNPADPAVAERFELYLDGVELANGFRELTDVEAQRQRFVADNSARQQQGRSALPLDEPFLAALAAGLPDCSGVALGIDRLLMRHLDANDIDEVLAFSLRRL